MKYKCNIKKYAHVIHKKYIYNTTLEYLHNIYIGNNDVEENYYNIAWIYTYIYIKDIHAK